MKKYFKSHRFTLIAWTSLILIILSTLTRILLSLREFNQLDLNDIPMVFVWGLFYDLINLMYFIVPMILYLWLIPDRWFKKRWHSIVTQIFFSLVVSVLIFDATAEWLFWDEFNTRFNFIAVDYLVYTTEVVGNIQQSYPLEWILGGILLLSGITIYLLRHHLQTTNATYVPFKERTMVAIPLFLGVVISFLLIENTLHQFSKNAYANELSGNGMYELFAAYRNNELDYQQYYQTIDPTKAFQKLRSQLQTHECVFIDQAPTHLTRKIQHEGQEKKLNVILISVESLSADYMDAFGNDQHITPYLDSLAKESLFFTNLFATGTRTVRGLEALSLCIPPTPGQSVVRRPHNEELFALSTVFEKKGYACDFIYGGYGYFDNMNYFFSNNHYKVVDRQELSEEEIDYENIWGVADENLFSLALREINNTTKNQKPIFAHIMTTSNHRPFTYPEGRIEIPSHSSREGAVKYTDFAIGQFIKKCSKQSWFANTVFIITADHCASSAGKTDLPIEKYHIPLLIYSPAHISPGEVPAFMSQIDIGPTLLGLLNFTYESKFFGYDVFQIDPQQQRAFISTYQKLGYIKGDKMVILSPQKKAEEVAIDFSTYETKPVKPDAKLIEEAVAWYETSSIAIKNNLYTNQY